MINSLIHFLDNFRRNKTNIPDTRLAKARRMVEMKVEAKKTVQNTLLIILGILSADFGLRGFLLPSGFLDGGATGISLLISRLSGANFSLVLFLVNIPFVVLGTSIIGRQFAIKTLLAIGGLSLCVFIIPHPQITDDKLLISIFGGFFLGAGIGLAVRGGAVIDGTEVLAIAISKKSGLTIGDVILIINLIIFLSAAWLLSINTALYAMLTYLSASKTVDFVIEGIEEYTGVTIISVKTEKIQEMIVKKLGRGLTVYKGERGHGKTGFKEQEMEIIYTVVTRLEISRLMVEVEKIDPHAFVITASVKDMKGGMIKKRPMK